MTGLMGMVVYERAACPPYHELLDGRMLGKPPLSPSGTAAACAARFASPYFRPTRLDVPLPFSG